MPHVNAQKARIAQGCGSCSSHKSFHGRADSGRPDRHGAYPSCGCRVPYPAMRTGDGYIGRQTYSDSNSLLLAPSAIRWWVYRVQMASHSSQRRSRISMFRPMRSASCGVDDLAVG